MTFFLAAVGEIQTNPATEGTPDEIKNTAPATTARAKEPRPVSAKMTGSRRKKHFMPPLVFVYGVPEVYKFATGTGVSKGTNGENRFASPEPAQST